ncbi:MAG TPA: acetate kinase [Rhabdochlamydiaceae bacterium]|nr:acetate kinase [Rhabdochlamydiaceae bacterium]
MNIFILNRGSSSIKCFLYDLTSIPQQPIRPVWEAHLQWKNSFDQATLKIKNDKGVQHSETIKQRSAKEALSHLLTFLIQGKTAVLTSLDEMDVIGHRIVHGGKYFKESVIINSDVKEKIRILSELAPLHNLPELEGIEILEKLFKNKPQIAVFDTAFHHSLPQAAAVYPGPYKWYEEGVQRYGFHGISYQYCSRTGAEMLGKDLESLKMIVCHLGSGASLCAIREGKSIDTTMGFTPLDGLMMDTRPGSIDPGIILHFLKKKNAEEISQELYYESGLLGVSGISSDMRDVMEKSAQGNARALLAFDVYLHRLNSLIGSMIASLQGIDVLIFTAGIGENTPLIREKVCETFSFLGLKLDKKKNIASSSEDREISTADSKIQVLVIHTQEAFEIARECWKKLNNP